MSKVEQKFKVGDSIIRIGDDHRRVKTGNIYIVTGISDVEVYLNTDPGYGYTIQSFKLYKEKEMHKFDLHTSPWYIRVENEEQFNLANEWLKENFGQDIGIQYSAGMKYLTNTDTYSVYSEVLYGSTNFDTSKEIKLNFKTTISSIEYPVVEIETEQQKRIRELKDTIDSASKQLEELMKETK